MHFSKGICKFQRMGKNNSIHHYMLQAKQLESSFAAKVQKVDIKLSTW